MQREFTGFRIFLIMLTIGLANIAVMNDMIIIPVAGYIAGEFAAAGEGVFNYILSGPVLVSGIFCLLCGKLMYVFRKKTLLLAGFAVFAAASCFLGAVNSPWYMAVMRTIIGASAGVCGTVSLAIIPELFTDEKKRSSMIGVNNAAMALCGSVLGVVSGAVAGSGWRLVYRIYLAAIPVLAMIALFIPKDSVSGTAEEEGKNTGTAEKMPWGPFLLMQGAFFIYNIVYCIVYYQIALLLTAKGYSDVSLMGMASALATVGSFASSITFGLYYGALKRFTAALGFGLMAFCYFLLWRAESVPVLLFANAILGGTYGIGISYYTMYCMVLVPPSKVPLSVSITGLIMGIGSFFSTFFATALQYITGSESVVSVIHVLVTILAAGAVISFVLSLAERKKAAKKTDAAQAA